MSDSTSSGAANSNNGVVSGDEDKAFLAIKAEKKALAEKLAKMQEQLKALEQEKQTTHESKLKEQNDWKALAEAKEKEANEYRSKFDEVQTSVVDALKINSFQRNLGGKIKDEAYFQFVDLNAIAYNPETRKVDEESVKSAVSEFVKRHSSLVEFKTGRMPNEAASSTNIGAKSVEEMSAVELEKYIKTLHSNGRL